MYHNLERVEWSYSGEVAKCVLPLLQIASTAQYHLGVVFGLGHDELFAVVSYHPRATFMFKCLYNSSSADDHYREFQGICDSLAKHPEAEMAIT